jgi:hypothetical protein
MAENAPTRLFRSGLLTAIRYNLTAEASISETYRVDNPLFTIGSEWVRFSPRSAGGVGSDLQLLPFHASGTLVYASSEENSRKILDLCNQVFCCFARIPERRNQFMPVRLTDPNLQRHSAMSER